MTPDREERIRQRAHELWERDGRPHGRHDDHWQQAREEIEAEALQMDSMKGVSADPAQDSPAPKRRGRPVKSDAPEIAADVAPSAPKRRSPRKATDLTTQPGDAPAPTRRRSTKAATVSDEQVAAGGSVQAGAPRGRKRKPATGGTEPEGAPSV